jgi:cobaltochelatase CobT
MPDNASSRSFANQIRRYIQAQARVQFDSEKFHGRLDKRGIVRLALPPIDGGEWNKKIFYEMRLADARSTCIMVLTDWSGSMNGMKMVHAADASGRLVHVFDRILRMPVQLAAFTNGRSRCDIGLIKKFDDRSVSPTDIATGFSRFYPYSSGNNDADAVMWAYNQCKRRKEDRKILIVLSDGCPAGSWMGGNSDANLIHVTTHIQKEGEVELYGVGIQSDAVETYYENCKVLNNESQINRTLFEIIKGGVKNAQQRRRKNH